MGIAVNGVAVSLEKACEEPEETERDYNPLHNFQVCQVKDANDQQQKLDEGYRAA